MTMPGRDLGLGPGPEWAAGYAKLIAEPTPEKALLERLPLALDGSVQQLAPLKRTLANEAARLAEIVDRRPLFSLVTPLWNTPSRYLDELIASCRLQTWSHWELLLVDDASTQQDHLQTAAAWAERDPRIKLMRREQNGGISAARNDAIRAATGTHIGILDHDDLLHPQALGLYARLLRRRGDVNFVFSNEVKLNAESTQVSEFYVKPDFDLATLERSNYVCHLTVIERRLLDGVLAEGRNGQAPLWFRSAMDGVEDHDLFLRLARLPEFRPFHLPVYAYYWRKTAGSTAENLDEKPYVAERGLKMLREYFADGHAAAALTTNTVVPKGGRGDNLFYSIHLRPAPGRKLAVIVPYRDQVDLTLQCLTALARQEHDFELTVVLVDNQSQEPRTASALQDFAKRETRLRYVWRTHPGAFNYARLNNQAIASLAETPDFILLLNNDVELLSADALRGLAGELERHARTAFVGLKLWYPGRQELQHGGIRVTPPLHGLGFHRTAHIDGAREYVDDEHVVHAVTFACAMVRHAVWQELGGLEEDFFPNGFGDVEICTRAMQRGYANFYMGTLEGIHHESKTRQPQSEELEAAMLSLFYPGELAQARRAQLGYDLHLAWNLDGGGSNWFEMHLRYRVADKVNEGLKKLAGPAHRSLKRWLSPKRDDR